MQPRTSAETQLSSGPRELMRRTLPNGRAISAARGLGWFSVGLGFAELLATERVARAIGLCPERRTLATMRAIGLREIASGVGALLRPRRAGPMWARVAGDAIDLTALGAALPRHVLRRKNVAVAAAGLVGLTALDIATARRLSRGRARAAAGQRSRSRPPFEIVSKAITIGRPLEEVRRAIEAEALPFEVRLLPAPGRRGTEVHVGIPVTGGRGPVARLLHRLRAQARERDVENALRRLKQRIETGDVVRSDASQRRGPHPARPDTHRDEETRR